MKFTNTPFKRDLRLLAGVALVASVSIGYAEGAASYNEAVHLVDGRRVVDVASFPSFMKAMVPSFHRPDEHPPLMTFVSVVETPQGQMDCLGTPFFHPQACSPSTYGRVKFLREWTVEMHGKWFSCVNHDKPKQCIPLIADGQLRAIAPESE